MPQYALKQSSTARPLLFLMVDSTDHVTGKTGLSPTVTLSKNGAAFGSPAGAVTELSSGWYQVAGNATDSGTLGALLLHATGTGADPCDAVFEVVAYDPHDAVRLGLTALPNAAAEAAGGLYTRGTGAGQINQAANGMIDTNPVRLNNVSQSLLDLKDFADDGYDPSTNKLTGLLLADAVTTVNGLAANVLTAASAAADLTTELQAGLATAAALATVQADTDDIQTRLPAALISGRMDASVGAMAADVMTAAAAAADLTTELQAGLATAAALATVQADTDDIQTRLPAALVGGRIDASVGAMAADVMTAAAAAGDLTTELQAGLATAASIAALNNLSAAQVNTEVDTALADARLDELLVADSDIDGAAPPAVGSVFHELLTKTAGSFTYDQATDSLEALRDNLATSASLATVQADTDDIQTRLPAALVSGRMDSSVGAMAADTVTAAALSADAGGEIADSVWDEALAGHAVAGSAGAALSAAGSAGDPWSTALPGAYGAGTAGKIVGDNLDAAVSTRATPAQIAAGAVASVTGAVGSVTGNVGGNVTGSVGSVVAGVTLAASAVTAIWDALTSALTTAGSIGKLLVDNINATISSRLATAGYTAPPTALANADAVWDEAIAGHLGAGSTGEKLNAASAAGDPWGTPLPGAYGAGTAGQIVGDNVNATISSRAAPVDVEIGVENVLTVNTYGEVLAVPAATSSIGARIAWLFALARNKITQTATTQSLKSDAGVSNIAAAVTSDDGSVFVREEWS